MYHSKGLSSFRNKLYYVRDQIKKYGIVIASKIIIHEFLQKRTFLSKGISFPDFSENIDLTISTSVYADAHENKESSFYAINKAFSKIPLKPGAIKFLDIGCGSGKSMVMGMVSGFDEVNGIDLDQPSLEHGKKNCHQMQLNGSNTRFSFTQQDATLYTIPPGTNVVYMFNPFGIKTLNHVVRNIQTYIEAQTFDVYIIYMNPKYIEAFTQKKYFDIHYTSLFKGSKQKEMVILKRLNKSF